MIESFEEKSTAERASIYLSLSSRHPDKVPLIVKAVDEKVKVSQKTLKYQLLLRKNAGSL